MTVGHDPSLHPADSPCDTCKALGIGMYAPGDKIVSFQSEWINRGFTQFWNVVLLNGSLSVGARLLWATLAHYARQDNEAWPGQERIALTLGTSERSVRTYLRELEDADLVTTKRRMKQSNLYTLLDPSPAYVAALDRQMLPVSAAESAGEKKTQLKETQREEDEQLGADGALFKLPPAASELNAPKDDTDIKIERVWQEFETCFPGRYRSGLTKSRRDIIRSGLKGIEGNLELALQAVQGLKAYRAAHPEGSDNVDVSVVFKTNMHDTVGLTEKIERWARNVDGRVMSDVMADVPQVLRGQVMDLRSQVREGYRTEKLDDPRVVQALGFLRERFHMVPDEWDGKRLTWKKADEG